MSPIWIFVVIAAIVFLISLFLDKILNPWLAERSMKKFLADFKAGKKSKPRDYEFEIISDSVHFTVLSLKNIRTAPVPMKWSDVQKITAFKRDLFNVDQICLFMARADETGIELNEDMKGFSELAESLSKFLPTCKPFEDWIWKVAETAFAANPTEIYNRIIVEQKAISA